MEARVGSFIQHALIEMILHKVEIQLIQQNSVSCGHEDSCAGFFDDDPKPVFVCAMGCAQRDWIPIFIHEYCHFLQWKEQSKIWINFQKIDKGCILDKWISGKIELSTESIKKVCNASRDIELDCEKRSVEIIKRFDLEFNIDEYIQKSNSYILYFNLIPNKRCWFTKESPTNIKKITDIMSTKFLKNYNRTPKKYTQLVNKYCF